MKQLLFGVLAIFGLAFGSTAFTWEDVPIESSFEFAAFASGGDVEYGRGPNCDQRGICSYAEGSSSRTASPGSAVFAIDANNNLMLVIDRSSLSRDELREQFVDGKFQIQDDGFIVPLSVMQQLGKNRERPLPGGDYDALITDESVIITFGR